MNKNILAKYSVPVPRYTSYPPANYFNDSFTAGSYHNAIIASNDQQPEHISVYIHIPFCLQMCYYCGCNSVLQRNKQVMENYIEALKKEIKLVLPLLDHNRKISQIHYGGGTPTTQPVSVLKELNQLILSDFECIDEPEIAIECHPGYLKEDYWRELADAGFNRISLGIQDFDRDVLKASNRKPSLMDVGDIVSILREKGISINMDFIYGLPLQTPESFSETIEHAISLKPDRIVTFAYAHVPWVNPLQLNLEKAGLPAIELKDEIYETAKKILLNGGYNSVGLDHFVQSDDELYLAQQSKTLHRNFQGYCTRRTTGQVYAFGVTGISQLATAYAQNTKDIDIYIEQVNRAELPVLRGYELSKQEQITREVISSLMCNYLIDWADLATQLDLSIAEVKAATNYDESVLNAFVQDGIVQFDDTYIKILPDATQFVRNVAASLDKLMLANTKQFSKSV